MNNSTESLESEYRVYGNAFGAAVKLGDPKAIERNYKKRSATVRKLRACGEQGEAILRRLMKDHSEAVAVWAATDSLIFAEAEALKILDAIGKKNGLIPFHARIIAEQWRKGELNADQMHG